MRAFLWISKWVGANLSWSDTIEKIKPYPLEWIEERKALAKTSYDMTETFMQGTDFV